MLRGLAIVVAAGALGACLRPALIECGELACAAEQVCHDNRCLDPSLLDACETPPEGAACDALGEPGRCIDNVCEVATCGDGYVDEVLREECDASVPDVHCIDLGYDLGRPGCTACRPDPTLGCSRFGWERLVDAPTIALWIDGDTQAYVTSTGLTIRAPSGTMDVPGVYSEVHAAAGRVIAFHQTSFVDVFEGLPIKRSVPDIEHARVGVDGTVYALDGCRVYTVTDRLTPFGPPAVDSDSCSRMEVGPPTPSGARIYVAGGIGVSDRVYRWDPDRAKFDPVSPATGSPITDMRFHGDRLWVATTTGAYTIDDTNRNTDLGLGFGPTTIAFSPTATYFGDNDGMVARVRDGRVQRFRAPGLITGDGDIYSYRGPIYRFRGTTYGTRDALSSQLEVVGSVQEADGTVVVATKAALHVADATGAGWSLATSPAQITRGFAGADQRYFISDFTDTPSARNPMLYSGDPESTWAPIPVPMNPLLYALWWAPDDSTLFAVGDNDAGDAFLGVRRGTMWETAYRTGCTVRGVHGTDSSHVIAVGGCGDESVVWGYDGTQWTELERFAMTPPLLAALRSNSGALVVAGASGAARFDGTAWSVDEDAVGSSLSGTSDSDVWLSGVFTSVQHFDGSVWSKLAVQASGPIAVTAAPDRVLFPGATEGFVELIR